MVKTRIIAKRKKLLRVYAFFIASGGGTVLTSKLPSSSLLTPKRPPVAVALVLYKIFKIFRLGFKKAEATKAWLFPSHSETGRVYATVSPSGSRPATFRTAPSQANRLAQFRKSSGQPDLRQLLTKGGRQSGLFPLQECRASHQKYPRFQRQYSQSNIAHRHHLTFAC